ncbi:hypothetical protein KIW84_074632 [Lathyrus oleraceus]|uniref:PABC domain-containing protein n=1 Tax=Pisum sativum TaxID=3888 RepID=A0A9D4ZYE1_PEA|nr:hypothetical protein KIW84_074632 [Pisum sativum]
MKTACSFALPHIMGWDRLTNQKPSETVSFQPNRQLGGTVGFQLKMSPQILDLEWLAPLAHDMLRWQPERSYEQMSFVSRTNVLLVQILHFTNQEKTEDDYSRQDQTLYLHWPYARVAAVGSLIICIQACNNTSIYIGFSLRIFEIGRNCNHCIFDRCLQSLSAFSRMFARIIDNISSGEKGYFENPCYGYSRRYQSKRGHNALTSTSSSARRCRREVTGMLLEMDQPEVLHSIESPDALKAKVAKAMDVLRNVSQQGNSPTDQLASR